jgi:hypothetical protein
MGGQLHRPDPYTADFYRVDVAPTVILEGTPTPLLIEHPDGSFEVPDPVPPGVGEEGYVPPHDVPAGE